MPSTMPPIPPRANASSIGEIIEANKAAGLFFFSPDTLRFFRSRIGSEVFQGCLFVTSEKAPNQPRRFTVRKAWADGRVESCSEFQQFATARQAKAWARKVCLCR